MFWFFQCSRTITIENEKESVAKVVGQEAQVQSAEQSMEGEENPTTFQELGTSKDVEAKDIFKDTPLRPAKRDSEGQAEKDTEVKTGLISWGYAAGRLAKVDTIIIHSVYNKTGGDHYSLNKILDIFKEYGVSAHYIIERDGDVHQLVAEKNTAYHAGSSKMPDGRSGVNSFSIGIELINAEDDKPTSAQYNSLDGLIDEIKGRQKIKYILGHSDIAPGRKTDPWNFSWSKVGGKKD